MKKFPLILGVAVVAVVGWLIISNTGNHQSMYPSSNSATQTKSSNAAPDFSLQDYNGETVKRVDFSGKPLVINSWAAWCPFCREELVDFAVAQKEFGDKVAIIAIDRAESQETAKKYTDELGVTETMIFLLDPSDSFYQSIGGFSMPETIFVDRNGHVAEQKRGPMEINEIRQKIQKLLSS